MYEGVQACYLHSKHEWRYIIDLRDVRDLERHGHLSVILFHLSRMIIKIGITGIIKFRSKHCCAGLQTQEFTHLVGARVG